MAKYLGIWTLVLMTTGVGSMAHAQHVRVATFNTSLFRSEQGDLIKELDKGDSAHAQAIAEILQTVRPEVVLLNEFDYDADGKAVASFKKNYLLSSQNGQDPIDFKYHFAPPTNTGIKSGMDLNRDGKVGGPADCWGFGKHPGQYGYVVLSKYPIEIKQTRTFQSFLWKDMPGARLPKLKDGSQYYSKKILDAFRLSSKNHCDVVIKVKEHRIHFLVSHPTPPVFDGEEDRNGLRNHDEIRFWNDYVTPGKNGYIYDDQGKRGGLWSGAKFVIAGDLNADMNDGDSTGNPIALLKKNQLVDFGIKPTSLGAPEAARYGKANKSHKGDPALDTADFNDETVGNLRIDYVLPSANLKVKSSGVFWPTSNGKQAELLKVTDHRLVWIDVSF